jgi:hypothetical protein
MVGTMTEQLPSSAERRFRALKHDFTLQVFLQEGPFWEAVHTLRERWRIQPFVRVPDAGDRTTPAVLDVLGPDAKQQQLRELLERTWSAEIAQFHDAHVPSSLWRGGRRISRILWFSFLAYCVLHDPPEMDLTTFAATGNSMVVRHRGIDPREVDLETWELAPATNDAHPVIGAPIVYWPDPDELSDVWRWFLEALLNELGRRHLVPLGIDIGAAVDAILRETGLRYEATERFVLPLHPLVTVNQDTRKEDVMSAFRAIGATQKDRSSGGRPKLDPLTAVECALMKQRGYSDPEIAERFGWPLREDSYDKRRRSNPVIDHVKLGRQVLAGRKNPAE